MSVGHNETLKRYLAMIDSGELDRARHGAKDQTEWAARVGMTIGQFRGVQRRAEAIGLTVPRWADGSAYDAQPVTDDALPAKSGHNQTDVAGYGCESDFTDEERTVEVKVSLPLDGDNGSDSFHGLLDEMLAETGGPTTAEESRAADEALGIHRARLSGVRDPFTRYLTREDVPAGSIIGVFSDIHFPYQDDRALRVAVDCAERVGVTHVFLNGDIADCGPSSRHEEKRARDILLWGDLPGSIRPGLWFYEWARTKRCIYVFGNHEGWIEKEIKCSATMHSSTPESLMGLPEHGDGWETLPMLSRIRLGSRVWEHGDGFFKSGSPGANPGARLKSKAPDQTTSIGHCHIKHASFWSTEDEHGISRTRAAFFNGHLSRPEAHGEYAGTYINWQQSFELTRVWYDGNNARFTTDQPEIHRDKNGNPIFEYQGKVYR